MDFSNLPVSRYLGGAAAGGILLLSAIYRDRAVFDSKRKDLYEQPGWPLLGNLPMLIQYKDVLHDFLVEAYHTTNRHTATMSILGIPRHISTTDPRNVEHVLKNNFENYIKGPEFHNAMNDLFGDGIFNANGEEWKFQRKTASHIFNVKNFRDHFTNVFVEEIEYMSENIWDKAIANNSVVDFHDVMFKFTLDSFILLGFGVQLNALGSKKKVPFAEAFDEAQKNTFQRFVNPIWPITERLTRIAMPWKTMMVDHLKVVNGFAHDVITKRREEMARGEEHKDLLSRFMLSSTPLDDKALRDIVLNFVIAGRDTTAQALSWTFFMLMTHPRVEAKLVEEIERCLDEKDLYESIKSMNYAHAVFYEVLRLYPSVPLNQKFALDDDIWPDGSHIKKGDYILWSPYTQGRCELIWGADAKKFRPERWIGEQGELKRESAGQWPAFHAGPRVCLGQNLATLEALVAISFLLKRYKFSLLPDQDITYQISLTLPMLNGMKVTVQSRQSS